MPFLGGFSESVSLDLLIFVISLRTLASLFASKLKTGCGVLLPPDVICSLYSHVVGFRNKHILLSCPLSPTLVPRGLFPGFGGGAGKGPDIGRSHDHQTPRICGCTKFAYDRVRCDKPQNIEDGG